MACGRETGIFRAHLLNRITEYVRRGAGEARVMDWVKGREPAGSILCTGVVIRGVNKVVVRVWGSVVVGLCNAEGFGDQQEHGRFLEAHPG